MGIGSIISAYLYIMFIMFAHTPILGHSGVFILFLAAGILSGITAITVYRWLADTRRYIKNMEKID